MLTKVYIVKTVVFPVVVYGCESETIKKAECQRIHIFELWCWRRLLRVPWTARGSNESIPKGNQPWIITGRTDAKIPVLWPPDVKSRLNGKDPDDGKDRGQEKKGVAQDEMVRWHHPFSAHESEQSPGDGERQGSLVSYSPWGWLQRVRHDLVTEQQWLLYSVLLLLLRLFSRVWLLATPWTAAYQAPPSMGFSRQEYWSGVPLPSPLQCVREVI